ncbi:hypothetical protein C8Q73DRAFT_663123 [Cubamyces lactineus]|nr:hypothetical protein C8Q73DRAFT_663123 [Cubamyces lactineus]
MCDNNSSYLPNPRPRDSTSRTRPRSPQLDPELLLHWDKSAAPNNSSESEARAADKNTLAVLGHYVLAAAYTDVLFRSAPNLAADKFSSDVREIEAKLQESVDGWIGRHEWYESLLSSIGRVQGQSLEEERRLLFDVYIGTLFVRSGSGYDAVREWVEPLVDCGTGKGRLEDGAEPVVVNS